MSLFRFTLLVALLISQSVFSQNYPAPTFDNPRTTMNYFLKTMKGHKLGDNEALDMAVKSLDLSQLDPSTKMVSGRLAAKRLINTLDRIEYIDVKKIPTKTAQKIWTYRNLEVEFEGKLSSVEIAIAKTQKGLWLFTPKTVATIALYEQSLKSAAVVEGVTQLKTWKDKIKEKMPNWTGRRSFILLNGQWLGLFFIILLAFIIEKIVRVYVSGLIIRVLGRASQGIDEQLKKRFTLPSGVLAFAIVWSIGISFLEFDDKILSWFLRGGRVVITIGIIMAAYQMVDMLCYYLEQKAIESENKFDDILVPLIRKSAKTFIIAVGIIAVGDSLNLDMKGILAGMGIVGLGVSLAAKDTLSNLFGSLTVLLDRPFQIGDWVLIDGNIEGTVQEVGLRSCRIKTFYDSQITLPNGRLTNAHIDNYGRRTFRRFTTKIGVQYDTPVEKIEAFCEGIRQIILKHPHTRKDYFHVYLNGLGDSSLNILLYVFWKVPSWNQELQEKHRLLMDILRLGSEMGIEFAFPTQTLHMINSQNTEYDELPEVEKSHFYAADKAQNIIDRPYTPMMERSGNKTASTPGVPGK